jgi:acyl CoA:acetate/3-ketoacid CoA transferase
MFPKIVDAATSLSTLKDNLVVAVSGFNMDITPEYLIEKLYKRYLEVGHLKSIFIISDARTPLCHRSAGNLLFGCCIII